MRRTTLGPLSSADLNSSALDVSAISGLGDLTANYGGRKSLNTSGIGKMMLNKSIIAPGTGKKPTIGRPSLAAGAGASDRRTSLFISRPTLGGAIKRDDPRPVNNGAFKMHAIKEIESYMIENDYTHQISTQKLTSPTARDFQTIVTFMLRQLDSNFTMLGRVEDDVTLVAKALHYPFMPSKTAITAVGAPNTWPTLLAMLLWLVELLRYDSEIKARDADGSAGLSGDDSAAGTVDYFWWYLRQAYTLYLAGEDEKIGRLEADIGVAFDSQMDDISAEVAAEEATLAALEAELAALQSTPSPLPRLRAEVEDRQHSIAAALKTEAEMAEYARSLTAKHAEVAAEREQVVAACERARHELERVSSLVNGQELSVEDVRRMAGHKAALRERKDSLAASRTAAAAEVDRLKMDLRRDVDNLSMRVRDYHETARSLQLIPLGAKWSGGRDWSLRIDERALDRVHAPDYGSRGSADLKQAAYALLGCEDFKLGQKDYIKRLRTGLTTKAEESRANIRKLADATAESTERRAEMARLVAECEATISHLEAAARREGEVAEQRLRDGANEMSRVEAMRDERKAQLAAAQASARELSPSALSEFAAAIRHMVACQESERQAIKDAAARMALRATEHVERTHALLDHAAATVINAKNRQIQVENERGARISRVVHGGPEVLMSSSFIGAGAGSSSSAAAAAGGVSESMLNSSISHGYTAMHSLNQQHHLSQSFIGGGGYGAGAALNASFSGLGHHGYFGSGNLNGSMVFQQQHNQQQGLPLAPPTPHGYLSASLLQVAPSPAVHLGHQPSRQSQQQRAGAAAIPMPSMLPQIPAPSLRLPAFSTSGMPSAGAGAGSAILPSPAAAASSSSSSSSSSAAAVGGGAAAGSAAAPTPQASQAPQPVKRSLPFYSPTPETRSRSIKGNSRQSSPSRNGNGT